MEPLKIGLIGFGFIGRTHAINVVKHPDAKLKAVFSLEKDKDLVEKYGAKFYNDWRDLMDSEDLDFIIVATPTYTHAEVAIQAMSRGFNVFLEKPMDRTLDKCKAIIQAAKKNDVLLGLGHVLRFDPEYIKIKELIEKGAVGRPRMIRCSRAGPAPSWSSWFFDEEKSGGVILDLSIHDLDYECWIAGRIPEYVYASASRLDLGNRKVFGISHVVLDFGRSGETGVAGVELGYAEASWGAKPMFPFSTHVEVSGTDGLLSCSIPGKHSLEIFKKKNRVALNDYHTDPYYLELDDFIKSVRKNIPPKVGGDDGLQAVKVCLAALESAKNHEIIRMEGFL
ncbi:MAG: Gfo/Idh/MocA family protein [Promethearchaeota archaeon]